jgi:hypothetical protein
MGGYRVEWGGEGSCHSCCQHPWTPSSPPLYRGHAIERSWIALSGTERRATPVMISIRENASDIGVALRLGPPAIAGVRSKQGAVHPPVNRTLSLDRAFIIGDPVAPRLARIPKIRKASRAFFVSPHFRRPSLSLPPSHGPTNPPNNRATDVSRIGLRDYPLSVIISAYHFSYF